MHQRSGFSLTKNSAWKIRHSWKQNKYQTCGTKYTKSLWKQFTIIESYNQLKKLKEKRKQATIFRLFFCSFIWNKRLWFFDLWRNKYSSKSNYSSSFFFLFKSWSFDDLWIIKNVSIFGKQSFLFYWSGSNSFLNTTHGISEFYLK